MLDGSRIALASREAVRGTSRASEKQPELSEAALDFILSHETLNPSRAPTSGSIAQAATSQNRRTDVLYAVWVHDGAAVICEE